MKTAVIGSTMVPTLIAGIAFLPKHLLTRPVGAESTERVCIQVRGNGLSEEG